MASLVRRFLAASLLVTLAVPVRAREADRGVDRSESDLQVHSAHFLQEEQDRPVEMAPPARLSDTATDATDGFGFGISASEVYRRLRPDQRTPVTDLTTLGEANFRATRDTGDLLDKAIGVLNVQTQMRSPINSNTYVRGQRFTQIAPSGSYWVPARYDLDTMLSKIDSRLIREAIVIKGPYTVRDGPGFSFIELALLESPRYEDGYQWEGATSLEYKTNGEQWYGLQTVQGGAADWGYRVTYGHRTGNDYETGAGTAIPASYNSRYLDTAIGLDPTVDSRLEFSYLRLDQTDVEFPGLVFDMNFLVTDAFELTYVVEDQPTYDLFELEIWHNQTRFAGDTFRAGKSRQIPTLACNLYPYDGSGNPNRIQPCVEDVLLGEPNPGLGTAVTDVAQNSTGFSTLLTWGQPGDSQLAAGVDLRHLGQELNDIENQRPPASSNFPIPPSYSANPGIFLDYAAPLSTRLTMRAGTRGDWVITDAENDLPNVDEPISDRLVVADLQRQFSLWSAFVDASYEVSESLAIVAGIGYAQRPPTLTELYAAGSFIGVLQTGLTAVTGDPQLKPERNLQFDLGLQASLARFRGRANVFYSRISDYITFDARNLPEPVDPNLAADALLGQMIYRVAFLNTDLATLTGFELYGDCDLTSMVTGFATVSYVDGEDHARDEPSRYRVIGDRSDVDGRSDEALPGIPPLESRVGVRLHPVEPEPHWGLELSARIVARQNRIAASLGERETPGFAVWDVRSFWQARENLLLIAGVENFTDRHYREHLDYRTGLGVFQAGINFYVSSELAY